MDRILPCNSQAHLKMKKHVNLIAIDITDNVNPTVHSCEIHVVNTITFIIEIQYLF